MVLLATRAFKDMAPLLKRTKSHSAWARQAMMKLFRRKYQLCQPNFNPVPQHYEDMFHSFENPRNSVHEQQPLDHNETMNGNNITPESSSSQSASLILHNPRMYLQHARQHFLMMHLLDQPHQGQFGPGITHVYIVEKIQQTARELGQLQQQNTASLVSEQQATHGIGPSGQPSGSPQVGMGVDQVPETHGPFPLDL
ncbi:hypothetical protein DL546_001293 [Coniochaeta pulveracea]|uniref:Uncharacterized protein n=1 Tax=Coniochaeta pulveracea TaxID=177199 RepID=A0A420Y5Z5_9PEZI|nr:hypothetical protein DL546_001293 [Coniochaeta pulveracea]